LPAKHVQTLAGIPGPGLAAHLEPARLLDPADLQRRQELSTAGAMK
jgi:hypothetical protein